MAQPTEAAGKIPSAAEQLEASNALQQAETALQTAVETLTKAVANDERINGSARVQEAKAALAAAKKKYGWILDWQESERALKAAAQSAEAAAEKAAADAKAEMDAKAREAQAALDAAQAKLAADAAAVKKHIVKKGESLSLIAKQYYGDVKKWKQLYEANKATVGANPDLIQPGMELVIPDYQIS